MYVDTEKVFEVHIFKILCVEKMFNKMNRKYTERPNGTHKSENG